MLDSERAVYTVEEAAKKMGIATNSLYTSIKKGEFKAIIRIGHRVLIPVKQLENMLSGAGAKC